MKDVTIKPDAPSSLMLDKHADYIAAYGSKKDDYVSLFYYFINMYILCIKTTLSIYRDLKTARV